jgi:2-keto-4-pentenoate hydratase/2-oxohepta-3-ene-1,7-dioic acid hydratase in catechol pathway
MKIVRFGTQKGIKYGTLQGNIIHSFRRNPFSVFRPGRESYPLDGQTYRLEEVKLLTPCVPTTILGIGLNYLSHFEKGNARRTARGEAPVPLPAVPVVFIMPNTAALATEGNIVLPRGIKLVEFEGEIGIIIGKQGKDIPEQNAREYVMGYTCFNDVSDRDSQRVDKEATRAKGRDTFAPFGPWIETDANPDNLKLETYLNGRLRQSASTNELIFNVDKLISFISGIMTLMPGDVIATGTPDGVDALNPGDVVEVKIEKIGTLRNYVIGPE